MSDDKKDSCTQKPSKSPSGDITVPDATHFRFRKPMCRCTEQVHSPFPFNTLHKHFAKYKHKSVNTCEYCGNNDIYEYYITADRHTMKIYHNCAPQNTDDISIQTESLSDRDSEARQPISQSQEISDADSSGIGTGYSSMVSVFNGCNDIQSSNSSPSKSSNLTDNSSGQENSPRSLHGKKK